MAKTDKENQELETPLMKQYYSFKAKYPGFAAAQSGRFL